MHEERRSLRRAGGIFGQLHDRWLGPPLDLSGLRPERYPAALVEQAGRVWQERVQSEFRSILIMNRFLGELTDRSARQVEYREAPEPEAGFDSFFAYGRSGSGVYLQAPDRARVEAWIGEGYTQPMRTPDGTMIFVRPEKAREIRRDQANCMGCLSHCKFSNWKDHGDYIPYPNSWNTAENQYRD